MSVNQVLTADSFKDDEIAMVHHWQKLAGKGTYLAGFLTDELVADLERRIRDDWTMDVFAEHGESDSEARKARAEAGRLQQIIDEKNAREARMAAERAASDAALEASCKQRIAALERQLQDVRNEFTAAHARIVELEGWLEDGAEREQAAAQRIVQLKAMLWDAEQERKQAQK